MRRPARSRHCDRVKEVAGALGASHWGATQSPREGAADRPRKPGDLSPASHDNPRGKGGLNAKTRSIPAGRRVRAGSRPVPVDRRGRRRPRASPPTCAWSAAAARCSPKRRSATGTTSVKTSPKATCFGDGTGGSGKSVTIKGADRAGPAGPGGEVDGVAAAAADHRPLRLRPRRSAASAAQRRHGEASWYLKVNHKNPERRRRNGEAASRRRSPLGPGAVVSRTRTSWR